ncbi:hypothetical protein EKO04_007318 [Ascochyta lentis]|uniref:Uncharacterized protein n=1 Tax=Ascochyta lentis TaxID=205686 RepID=A0A8H7IZX3_9PLEO|nr:hypothetical protein EKO04_007318 [Ascochyta lentis]
MHKALLPRLYNQISLRWEAFKSPPRVSNLLKALAQAPDLAEKVEELSFYGKNYLTRVASVKQEQFPYQRKILSYLVEAKPKANAEDIRIETLLQRAKRNTRLSQAEWESVFDGQDALDIMTAAIIVLCPNLRALYLDSGFLNQNTVLAKIIRLHFLNHDNECLTPAFIKLKEVYLAQDMSSWDSTNLKLFKFPLSACLPFFYLPSLELLTAPLSESIGGSGISPPATVWPTANPPVCTVRTLDLHTSRVKAATLSLVLAQTPRLQSLHYGYWPWLEARPEERLDCSQVRCALESLSHTLTDLTISLNPFSSRADEVEEGGIWIKGGRGIGSLTFLSRLTKLEIALPVLFGWEGNTGLGLKDVLPLSLEDLCIRDDCISHTGNVFHEERTIEELQCWIGNKAWRKYTPNLKCVGLRLCTSIGDDWSKESRKNIMDICEQEGLGFWFVKLDPDQEYDAAKDTWYDADNLLRYPLNGPLSGR